MMKTFTSKLGALRRPLLVCALTSGLCVASPSLWAQNVGATVRGKLNAPNAAGAVVTAKEINTGFTTRATVGADGTYVLAGMRPGSYQITANADGKEIASSAVTAQVGQSLTVDLAPAPTSTTTTTLEGVTVTGYNLAQADLRNSEVAKNVSIEQIRVLPQNSRNFLNFAALAPGVTTPTDKYNKGFSAFGQESNQTNVFIDGASLKNNILQGGLVGQDSSKGNPFSQEAVQEFRVLTQNYKAEYEQGGAAIVSAVTKSGGNDFHGSVYGDWQTKGMVENEYFADKNGDPKPDYKRRQYGATFSGPIIKDTLQFFLSFEGNSQTDVGTVNINNSTYGDRFRQYNGTYVLPFNEKVWFGKLSWQPNENNNVDLSFTKRKDNETVDPGNTFTTSDGLVVRNNKVDDLLLKWQYRGHGFVNDLLIDFGKYQFNPRPAHPNLPAQLYQEGTARTIAHLGGANQTQNKEQKTKTLRDDITLDSIDWHGQHVVKFGFKAAHINLSTAESSTSAPLYYYDLTGGSSGNPDIPYRIDYSPSGKSAALSNNQYGLYVQDDWDVTSRLQLNLGIRWDYETNAYNNGYVTPLSQYEIINFLGLGKNYISTGKERSGYEKQYQPRLGFSYDVSKDNDQSTTIFGGAGRYFDRTPLDNPIQESFHSQYPYYNFRFSTDGRDGTVLWDPKYLTPAGLQSLITANAGAGEIDLLNNKTKPPHSDQFSLGVKQVMGDWVGTLTLSRVLSYNQFTWVWANRVVAPGFVTIKPPGSPYDPVLRNAYKKYQSTGVLIGLEKPYTKESGWGVTVSYTYNDARRSGGDAYSLDYVDPTGYPYDNVGEKNRLVTTSIIDLPWDIKFTSMITLGSGPRFNASRFVDGVCDYNCQFLLGYGTPKKGSFILPHFWAYRSVDLSLSKEFPLPYGQSFTIRGDVFNAFNFHNFSDYVNGLSDPKYGQPIKTTGVPRSFQVSARYSF